MALTEPQAGSSLTDLTTTADPHGRRILQDQGAEDLHLLPATTSRSKTSSTCCWPGSTARPPASRGSRSSSCPKKRVGTAGWLCQRREPASGSTTSSATAGRPITQLAFGDNDDCRGWLVGEPHKGLRYMFQMMNEARIDVGMGAAAIASAAYYASLEYARQRPQGRPVTGKDPLAPQVPIIEHADVKRMLLFQRAVVEGSLALIFQCAQYVDLARVTEGEEKERYELLLDLLTPVAKSYPSEMGILSVSQGLQCLGGYGYCDEFPAGAVLPRRPDPPDPRGDDGDPGDGPPGPEGGHEEREGPLPLPGRTGEGRSPPAGRFPSAPLPRGARGGGGDAQGGDPPSRASR